MSDIDAEVARIRAERDQALAAAADAADTLFSLFSAHIATGFTAPQALYLVASAMTNTPGRPPA